MNSQAHSPSYGSVLLTTAAVVVVIAGMRVATPILVPFLFAIFLALISTPPLFWLQKKGIPAWFAVVIILLVMIAIGFVLVGVAGTSLKNFSENMPVYEESLRNKMALLVTWLNTINIDLSASALRDAFDPGAAMKLVNTLFASLSGILKNAFLILFTVMFMLLEASSFPVKLRAALRNPDDSLMWFNSFLDSVKRYIAIKTLTSLITAIAVTLWLVILGVDYPVLWGLLAFLLNFVPTIGSFIAAVPAVLLALLQLGPASALLTVVGYVVINVGVGNLLEPRIMGRSVGLSPLVIFLSLVFWGWVLGPLGMVLSVPLTIMIKLALESSEETRWLAVMLGTPSTVLNSLTETAESAIKVEAERS